MRISKYNIEGYHDPTVYEALVNIEKERKEAQKLVPGRYRPLVYICSPYAGDVLNNERKARKTLSGVYFGDLQWNTGRQSQ